MARGSSREGGTIADSTLPQSGEAAGSPRGSNFFAQMLRGALGHQAGFLALVLIVMWLVFSRFTPYFLTTQNLLSITIEAAVTAIAAVGQTFVILSAGIDLSVGSVLALVTVVSAIAMGAGQSMVVGILLGLAVGGLCGFFNGIAVGKLRIPPFIATLGMMGIARGLALIVTGGVPRFQLARGFELLGQGFIGNVIPISTVVMVAVYAVAGLVLHRTRFGRYTYAIGSNIEATKLSGIDVSRYLVYIYTVAGLAVGVAGLIAESRLGSGQPAGGQGLELETIAAVVIGGTSLFGGEGNIFATLIGALIIASLRNGLNVIGVYAFWQNVVIGVAVILAVYADQWRRSRRGT
jgi:ribose transport system permease protein